jgi:hypothetical protein
MKHRGPLIEDLHQYKKKYKWPDVRMKLLFPKVVTDKWKNFLQRFTYPEDKVKFICKKFFESKGVYLIFNYLES